MLGCAAGRQSPGEWLTASGQDVACIGNPHMAVLDVQQRVIEILHKPQFGIQDGLRARQPKDGLTPM